MLVKNLLKLSFAASALAVVASSFAVNLTPGSASLLGGSAFTGDLGTQVAIQPFIVGKNALLQTKFTGQLLCDVMIDSVTGHLDFAYAYFNDGTSKNSPSRITTTGFAGWTTDVDYDDSGVVWLTHNVTQITPRSADRSADGDTIGFSFAQRALGGDGLIAPGDVTSVLFIKTNADFYRLTGSTSILNGAVATVVTYAPVPEPASMTALAIGGIAFLRRRKKA